MTGRESLGVGNYSSEDMTTIQVSAPVLGPLQQQRAATPPPLQNTPDPSP
jgi:hypothetical protein